MAYHHYFTLRGREPVEVSVEQWAREFNSLDRAIAKSKVDGKDITISTVFLGLNHRIGSGPPLLFETMVFGGKLDQECGRCSTWEQALRMHDKWCGDVAIVEERPIEHLLYRTTANPKPELTKEKERAEIEAWIESLPDEDKRSEFEKWRDNERAKRQARFKPS